MDNCNSAIEASKKNRFAVIDYDINSTLGLPLVNFTGDPDCKKLVEATAVIVLTDMVIGLGVDNFDPNQLLLIIREQMKIRKDLTLEDFVCFRDGLLRGSFLDYSGYYHSFDNNFYGKLSMAKINEWWRKYFEIKAISREQKMHKEQSGYKNAKTDDAVLERLMRQFLPENERDMPIKEIIKSRGTSLDEQLKMAEERNKEIERLRVLIEKVDEDIRPEDEERKIKFRSFLEKNFNFIDYIVSFLDARGFYVSSGIAMDYMNNKYKQNQ